MPQRKNESPVRVSDVDLQARVRQHLAFLGLTHTLETLGDQLAAATRESPDYTSWLERLLAAEVATKTDRRITRRVQTSGLVERKTLEAFDWDFQPKLDKKFVLQLAQLDFIQRHDDLLITGKPGTGKSHILKALGLCACQRQLNLRYARCVDLLADLHAGLADGSYPQRLKAWTRPALVIIDDVGLGQVRKSPDEPSAAHTLYNLIDRRHGQVSTAITSNIKLSRWGHYLGDATVTAAILDRLAMHAIRIDIDGPSYRQHAGKDLAAQLGIGAVDDTSSDVPAASDD